MIVTECDAVSAPSRVQAGDPGTIVLKKLAVLGDPFVQPTVVAPAQIEGAAKPIQIMIEEVLVGTTIQGVPLGVTSQPHCQLPGATSTSVIVAVAPPLAISPVSLTLQSTNVD
ncbi:hypothetical protein [Caulobacter endophyticus]|uniref:hypothetical protein n=1 Tax=Caulobacter endophyticus TaxID=2172652 RepID=UPI00240F20DE|nr:hypothetical protein [Caulobacter endophyticus]MDG2529974.1 hypothetical protein [Caulobacter endophyticus]